MKGSKRKVFTINEFTVKDTIRSLKLTLSNKFNIPTAVFYLMHNGKILDDDKTLMGVQDEASIRAMFRSGSPIDF